MAETHKDYKIEDGIKKISIPREKPRIVVAYPFFGPADAKTLRDQIEGSPHKLRVPTLGENVVFLDVACRNDKEPEFQKAIEIMRARYFRAYTVTHYDPTDRRLDPKLVYVFDLPEFTEERRLNVDNDRLVARLGEEDKSVRTIPKEQVIGGVMTSR